MSSNDELKKNNNGEYLLYHNLPCEYENKLILKNINKGKTIWVIDKPGNHPNNKINVLYSDGTVQTVDYIIR